MSHKPNLSKGVWSAACAVCGFVFNSNELKKRWDGVMVCDKDWEPRNVLDFFRVREEKLSVPWTQHEGDSITNYATITSTDSPYTATSSIYVIDVSASGGNVVINIPLASTYVFAYTQRLQIRRTDSSANTVTVQRQGADTIDGGTSTTIGANGSLLLENNASTAWRTVP